MSPEVSVETNPLSTVVSLLQERLPPSWRSTADYGPLNHSGQHADAVIEVQAPGGQTIRIIVEVKSSLITRDLPGVVEQVRHLSAKVPGPTVPLIASRYLAPTVRDWLEQRDLSYADATGNLRVVAEDPALYVRDRGADRDPWRKPGRPRGTLKGAPAWGVVRALADLYAPLPITTLIAASDSSTGVVYRVLDFLDEESLLTRGPRGVIASVLWRRLLERWSQDYGFLRDNTVGQYLQPRGLGTLSADLRTLDTKGDYQGTYAVTGSLAVPAWTTPYAPTRQASLYVSDSQAAARALGLRLVDTGGNVLLATPPTGAAFARAREIDGARYASPSQVAVDLLTGPGRNPAEGTALLDWMETDEPAWRAHAERSHRST